jgi:hypothetical protein
MQKEITEAINELIPEEYTNIAGLDLSGATATFAATFGSKLFEDMGLEKLISLSAGESLGEGLKVRDLSLSVIDKLIGDSVLVNELNGPDGLGPNGHVASGLIFALSNNVGLSDTGEGKDGLAIEGDGLLGGQFGKGAVTLDGIEHFTNQFGGELGGIGGNSSHR